MNLKKISLFYKRINKAQKDINKVYSIYNILNVSLIMALTFFIVDKIDLLEKIIDKTTFAGYYSIISVLICLLIIFIIKNSVLDFLNFKSVTPLDFIFDIIIVSLTVYIFFSYIFNNEAKYITEIIGLAIADLIICIERLYIISNNDNIITTTVDLKDIYENNFKCDSKHPLFVSETDVNYDLFNRDRYINEVCRTIKYCDSDKGYVIGLEGEWGTGKTTILNNVKKSFAGNEKYIFIDDFDPWLFGNPESLIQAMFSEILTATGIAYKPYALRNSIRNIVDSISKTNSKLTLANTVFKNIYKEDSKIKEQVVSYLKGTDKKIIFVIDNLDRANSDNIILLFKLINLVFDLPRIIYILSFEKSRINEILKNSDNIDSNFIEKIIQQEIKVPAIIDEKSNDIYATCIVNILNSYKEFDIKKYIVPFHYIMLKYGNIRNFKRMINTVFPMVFEEKTMLNKVDLLELELIHFFDEDLYNEIKDNSRYFVSCGMSMTEENRRIVIENKAKEEATSSDTYIKSIFSKHKDSADILIDMFPQLVKYQKFSDMGYSLQNRENNDNLMIQESRIYNGAFFDLYFSFGLNHNLEIKKQIISLIDYINISKDQLEIKRRMNHVLMNLDVNYQDDFLNQLEVYSYSLTMEKRFIFIRSIMDSIEIFKRSSIIMYIPPRERVIYIISNLLIESSNIVVDKFYKCFSNRYSYINYISKIVYILERNKSSKNEYQRIKIEKLYNKMIITCIEKNINILNNNNYVRGNLIAVINFCEKNNMEYKLDTYVKSILSQDTVHRFIWEFVSDIHNNTIHRYYIENDRLKYIDKYRNMIMILLKNKKVKTKSEKFVEDIYYKQFNGVPDYDGLKTIENIGEKNIIL